MTSKAQNTSTGTVHYAAKRDGHLMQTCGYKRNQEVSLTPVADSVAVTCGRCAKRPAKAAKAAPVARTFGRQQWTISELRDTARTLKIKGHSRMDGDALLAAIVEQRPQFA